MRHGETYYFFDGIARTGPLGPQRFSTSTAFDNNFSKEYIAAKSGNIVSHSVRGKYVITLTIEQHDVTKPFIILLPIEIQYRNVTTARARLPVDQLKKEFTYEVEREPEKISFNIFESVLCNIEDEVQFIHILLRALENNAVLNLFSHKNLTFFPISSFPS